jgi:hypothetical protein
MVVDAAICSRIIADPQSPVCLLVSPPSSVRGVLKRPPPFDAAQCEANQGHVGRRVSDYLAAVILI